LEQEGLLYPDQLLLILKEIMDQIQFLVQLHLQVVEVEVVIISVEQQAVQAVVEKNLMEQEELVIHLL
jgi:hypothetical protein